MKKSTIFLMFLIIVVAVTGCNSGDSGNVTTTPEKAALDLKNAATESETKSETVYAGVAKPDGYPIKDIEIVCHTNPGDGADVYVRAISSSINQGNLLPVVTVVANKSGGSGANMYNYMMQKKGDPYYMMTCQPNLLTSPIKNNLNLSYKDFTPVACLATEPLVVTVNVSSNYNSMADLIAAASIEEKAITQAGGLAGATEYFLSYMIEQETGVVFNLLPHAGGGSEAMVTLLAGDADFMISNPSEVLSQVEADKLRIIAVGTEERISLLPEVSTLIEQNIDATFGMFRGIAMPGEIDEAIVDYVSDALRQVTETPEWAKYCEENGLVTEYKNGDEFEAYLDEQNPTFVEVLASYDARLQ